MRNIWLLAIMLLPISNGWAVECTEVFPSVVQSNSSTGTFSIDNGAQIINAPSTVLNFVTGNINANSGDSCESAECSVSGSPASSISLPTFQTVTSSNDASLTGATIGEGSFTGDSFRTLTIQSGTNNFSDDYDEYFINNLTINTSATLTFRPGVYWINTLSINSGTDTNFVEINVEGTGTAYVYVNSNLTSGTYTQINGLGSNALLVLNVYRDVSINTDSSVSSLLYTDGAVTVNSNASFTGVMSSTNLSLNASSTVYYQDTLFEDYEVTETCIQPAQMRFFQFEESDSSSAAVDDSDEASDGTYLGSAEPLLPSTSEQVSCKVLDVPSNTSESVFDALNTGLDINDDLGNAGTISFWYRSDVGWDESTERQLFDASQEDSSDVAFYLSLDDGKLQFSIEDSNDESEVLTKSSLSYSSDVWVHVAITWDLEADTMALYLDGVEEDSDSSIGLNGVIGELDTLYIGDNRSTLLNGASTPNSAHGQFDDVRIYNFSQSAAEIAADIADVTICELVNHYRIEHDASGFTCESESVTIKACADEDCDTPYTDTVSVTLSPSGWEGGDTISFSDGETTASLNVTDESLITFGQTSSSPSATLRCFNGDDETCDMDFVNDGFDFFGTTISDPLPDTVAEGSFTNVNLRAVRDNAGVCEALLEGEQSITLGYDCTSPDSCQTSFAGITIGDEEGENTGSVTLTFDSDGIASLKDYSYADAGRLSLSATAEIDGVTIEKATESIDVYPSYLQLSVDNNDLIHGNSGAQNNYVAGETFTFEIGAYGTMGTILPNYSQDTGTLQIKVGRVAPSSTSAVDGSFEYSDSVTIDSALSASFADAAGLDFSAGKHSYAGSYYDEVGRIEVDIQDASYLGNQVASSGTLTLGDFYPAFFKVTESQRPTLADSCDSSDFSYLGQAINFTLSPVLIITAYNALDEVTANYSDGYWSYSPTDTMLETNTAYVDSSDYADGEATGNSISDIDYGDTPIITDNDNYDGTATLTINNGSFQYNKVDVNNDNLAYAPVSPFDASMNIEFSRGLFEATFVGQNSTKTICNQASYTQTTCLGFTFDEEIEGTEIRYGRLALESSYGPETEDLNVPIKTEYYDSGDSGQWLHNTDDSCTAIDFNMGDSQIVLTDVEGSIEGLVGSVESTGELLMGEPVGDQLVLDAPGLGNVGQFIISLNPDATGVEWPTHLNFNWNTDGDSETVIDSDDFPSATITFGQFRGNDRVIQWREVFN